ncbi:putative zinc finger MYND domain protein [Monocercomonoides exilis]|uniref:putative zinc finger MYND domain protein n=1 Tax=Monocercomonoides exilis TaxID=2049356 RepID=UPI0035598E0B|nr:putative zinc finger MYND domain protein [Monocercomonoides exilis]|eukprot:MONOS_12239.1-p1 / transcript=MONOS_12239.1 / gene=MONOS_12239 / organism=Monocercomonoides_exilis_PA203 / gene_product=zinc finger MYND domain protein / transcript_product=zinc finger MYND domain protein / location=Mono_scaffold00664:4534-7449(+) / protein_length=517 / sequence_SO=supercontig / SO=protein_coding / is_pseudo=false
MSDGLTPMECEAYIKELIPVDSIKIVGSSRWMKQHQIIEKINAQAHHCVLYNIDEFVVQSFLSFPEKISVLIQNLLAVEIWKTRVFPKLSPSAYEKSAKPYLILFNEAVLLNLLEVMYFHKDVALSTGDSLAELAEYCHRKIAMLLSEPCSEWPVKDIGKEAKMSASETLADQNAELSFRIAMSAINITRFLSEYLTECSLGVGDAFLVNGDIITLLIELILKKPWIRTKGSKTVKFEDLRWENVPPADKQKVTKIEAQVWLSLYCLLTNGECQRKYRFDQEKKEKVKKLIPFLTEVLIDQIPPLKTLQSVVLSIGFAQLPEPEGSKEFMRIQIVSDMRESLMRGQNWDAIAKEQEKTIFNLSRAELMKEMESISSLYTQSFYSEVSSGSKCGFCGKKAQNRCSKCRSVFYCSVDCQRKHWKIHKLECDKLKEEKEKEERQMKEKEEKQKPHKAKIEDIDDDEEVDAIKEVTSNKASSSASASASASSSASSQQKKKLLIEEVQSEKKLTTDFDDVD